MARKRQGREARHVHHNSELLLELPDQRLLRRLALLDLPAGKFPQTCHGFAERTLRNQHATVRVLEKLDFVLIGQREDPAPARGGGAKVELRQLRRPAGRRVLVSAVALVDADGRVLLARRPAGKPMAGLWEFPGGKVNDDETPEAALIRELKEELAIDVAESCLAPLTFASHHYPEFDLLMPLYVCRRWEGTVTAQEGQHLAWVRPNRLKEYPMPPADVPLISHLTTLL